MANSALITLQQLFRYYRQLPHQIAGLALLEEDLQANGYKAAMQRDRQWFTVWSQAGKQPDSEPVTSNAKPTNPLTGFPWFPQLDNGEQGFRQCQSSSIAMCLAYLGVANIKDDLDYLKIVNRYGDTTSQVSHQLALKSLGVRARFIQNCSASQVQAEIKSGLPVCLGVLHKGPVGAPSGGGHWIACYGYSNASQSWIVNDPYGELNLLTGQWSHIGGNSGKGLMYSYRNLSPRWQVEGVGTGWAWLFS